MALPTLAAESITILTPVLVTERGSQVPDWKQPPATTLTVPGCSVQPQGGADDRAHRDALGAVFTVWAPPGTQIGSLDHVLVDSYPGPLILDGEPMRWAVGFLDHVVFQLTAWKG